MDPVIVDRAQHVISRTLIAPEALKVLYRLKDAGYTAYLAGGGVRDLLLGRTPKDFDIATSAHPNEVRRVFRNCRLIGRRFRLAHVFYPNVIIEVSTFRANVAPEEESPGEHLFRKENGLIVRDNVFGTPSDDAFRRDFTVNALFYNIADYSVIDYVNGLKDLDARIIRVIGDARGRFIEDPVRMIRALRFAGTLGFEVEESARQAIVELKDRLALASMDRLYDECLKLFFYGSAGVVVASLIDTGLLGVIFPPFDAWLHAEDCERRRAWVMKVLQQLDTWKKAGMIPSQPLLWALLFGAYHEHLAQGVMSRGLPENAAMAQAVTQHLLGQANRVKFAKAIAHDAATIMAVQPSFDQVHGKKPQKFSRRPCFHDAFVYFKFSARLMQRRKEALDWWNDFWAGRDGSAP